MEDVFPGVEMLDCHRGPKDRWHLQHYSGRLGRRNRRTCQEKDACDENAKRARHLGASMIFHVDA
jgi:hypothetical protein